MSGFNAQMDLSWTGWCSSMAIWTKQQTKPIWNWKT